MRKNGRFTVHIYRAWYNDIRSTIRRLKVRGLELREQQRLSSEIFLQLVAFLNKSLSKYHMVLRYVMGIIRYNLHSELFIYILLRFYFTIHIIDVILEYDYFQIFTFILVFRLHITIYCTLLSKVYLMATHMVRLSFNLFTY